MTFPFVRMTCRERAGNRSVFRGLLKPNEGFVVATSTIKATPARRNDRSHFRYFRTRWKKPREILQRIDSDGGITLSSRNCPRQAIKYSIRLTNRKDLREIERRKNKNIFDQKLLIRNLFDKYFFLFYQLQHFACNVKQFSMYNIRIFSITIVYY